MGRPPMVEGMEEARRGPWSPEEDIMLVSYIQEHGAGSWKSISENAGLQRCAKSCSLRWRNHLRPGIKRGNFTPQEDQIIIRHRALLGNRWAAIAAHLHGRSDNDVKNYWNIHLKKKLDKVDSSCDERAKTYEETRRCEDAATTGGVDYIKAYYDKMYKHSSAGNSVSAPPQDNHNQERLSINYDKIQKWLLADSSVPFPELLPATAPAAPAPAHDGAPGRINYDKIQKWLLADSSVPFPELLPATAPSAPAPPHAPGRDQGHYQNSFESFH